MSSPAVSPMLDGLEELQSVLTLPEIMRMIEQTARWVSKETFQLMPMWFPEYARQEFFYKANWTEPQLNKNRETKNSIHKKEGNRYANLALTTALGLKAKHRKNWSCCHIWGIDDGTYQKSNSVVKDRRFYSCVANMILLPAPLKAFTDVVPEVKEMLRICSINTFEWTCDHPDVKSPISKLQEFIAQDVYPMSWPKSLNDPAPSGTMEFNETIEKSIIKRKNAISKDLTAAGEKYPRSEVRDALNYWNMEIAQ